MPTASSRPALSISATLDVDTEALKAKATAAAESVRVAVARARSGGLTPRCATDVQALEAAKAQPVVAAYGAGLLVGLYFVEKLIHLPVLDLVRAQGAEASARAQLTPPAQVIAFPLELLGVITAGVLALRYTKEGVDVNGARPRCPQRARRAPPASLRPSHSPRRLQTMWPW